LTRRGLVKLQPAAIHQVVLQAYRTGSIIPSWVARFNLYDDSEPQIVTQAPIPLGSLPPLPSLASIGIPIPGSDGDRPLGGCFRCGWWRLCCCWGWQRDRRRHESRSHLCRPLFSLSSRLPGRFFAGARGSRGD
ncbi:MAG: hypothetical protein HC925_03315, partial [Coleofasciculaceae cyanobacterium SM2_3_26]|nr:hypothetical protein [Coleofasciculaceae cyanobacterium SM2_3_26]